MDAAPNRLLKLNRLAAVATVTQPRGSGRYGRQYRSHRRQTVDAAHNRLAAVAAVTQPLGSGGYGRTTAWRRPCLNDRERLQ